MNVYDFDKTIFYPDSSYCFIRYCLFRHPLLFIKHVPRMAGTWLLRSAGKCTVKELKEAAFSFLKDIKDPEQLVQQFWDTHFTRVRKWYLEQKQPTDVVVSASPEFLIGPCCERLGIRYMGTRMDVRTGRITGENCRDGEKVLRFRAVYPDAKVERFYSDSYSDSPMAKLADQAFLVKKDELFDW